MGTAGLIYAAIVIAWLAYLVPMFLRRHRVEESRQAIRPLSSSVRMVRRPVDDTDDAEAASVSTPMTRRAALRELRRLDLLAARRRRNVLTGLMFVATVALALAVAEVLSWWWLVVPGGLILTFFVGSRISVVYLRRDLDRRRAAILGGDEEDTVAVAAGDPGATGAVALGVPEDQEGQLWDPLPITASTYVSRPVAGRSIRTIDFGSAATGTDPQQRPVTADEPTEAIERSGSTRLFNPARRPRAVGE